MKGTVLIPQNVSPQGIAYLQERGYEIVSGSGVAAESLKQDVVHCDAILVRTAAITREVMEAGSKLKVIAKHGVGVDNIDLDAAAALGICVTHAPQSNLNTVAEHTLALLVAWSKRLLIADRECRRGGYEIRNRLGSADLEGKVLGIVGAGRIGWLVARKASALGMKIMLFDPYLSNISQQFAYERCGTLDHLLAAADFVSLHLPLTPATRRMIGSEQFQRMKPSACFINVSRGEIVDEEALVAALQSGVIAGAALDVFDKEPPDADNPLFGMDQVIVTPHAAALTREAAERMALHAAMGIDEVLSGRPPSWPVKA